jgi:hypothetical protein
MKQESSKLSELAKKFVQRYSFSVQCSTNNELRITNNEVKI